MGTAAFKLCTYRSSCVTEIYVLLCDTVLHSIGSSVTYVVLFRIQAGDGRTACETIVHMYLLGCREQKFPVEADNIFETDQTRVSAPVTFTLRLA
jgi:hypothetical protein